MSQQKANNLVDCNVENHCGTECHKKRDIKSENLINVELLSELEKTSSSYEVV